jgi:integrase/recombinase XerC
MEKITKYAAGEMLCAACKQPLPAVETWPGRFVIHCERAECQLAARNHPARRYVGDKEVKCQAPGCGEYVPSGSYVARQTHFACCGKCWRACRVQKTKGYTLVTCACGCGEQFRSGKAIGKNYFFNRDHHGRFVTEQALQRCGIHRPLVQEYREGFCMLHYSKSSRGSVLTSSVAFCEFLNERGIVSMNDVTPSTITAFLIWGRENGRNQVEHSICFLKIFFDWQIAEERRLLPNPIVNSIHCIRRQPAEPRPLSDDQLQDAWKMLDERGSARIRLAMAIGEESGLRISEIANVRIQDVDLVRQRITVRLPTKGKKPRWVPYGEKTRVCLDAWLKVRDPDCGHDNLLHGAYRKPSTAQSIRDEFNKVLTKRGSTYHNGHQTNPDGFDTWSTHALRHTMTSNLSNGGANAATVKAIGGWGSDKAMNPYIKVDETVVQRGYETAMKRSKEERAQKKPVQRVSLGDLAKRKKAVTK